METVYEGVLEVGKEATAASVSPKDWKPRLFVLRRDTTTKTSSLSCYKDTRKRWQKQVPKETIQLHPKFEISIAHTSGYKFPMKLVTEKNVLFLSANTYHLMTQWLYHIQTQRNLLPNKRGQLVFTVEAQDSRHMNVIGARGDCHLAITIESEIVCAILPSDQVVGVWSFNCLRRYWCGEGTFGFEAGKRSPRGEGTYIFVTDEGPDIYRTLKQFIEKAKQATLQGRRSAEGVEKLMSDVNIRPQYPLPSGAYRRDTLVEPASDSDEEGERREADLDDDRRYDIIPTHQGEPLVGARPTSPFKRGKANTSSLHHTDVSGPSPAYIKRAHTTKPRRVQQWLQATEGSRLSREGMESAPVVEGDVGPMPAPMDRTSGFVEQPEEDTYSHTQHVFPAPFQRHATDHNVVDKTLYHSLVHEKAKASSTPEKKRASQTVTGPQDGTEENIYNIAYPPDKPPEKKSPIPGAVGPEPRVVLPRPRVVDPSQDSQYGTLERSASDPATPRGRSLSNLPLAPAKTASMREETDSGVIAPPLPARSPLPPPPPPPPPPPEQNPLSSPSDLEDSMMDNPIYNSKDNLLQDMASLPLEPKTSKLGREGIAVTNEARALSDPPPERGDREEVERRCHSSASNGCGGGEKEGGGGEEAGEKKEREGEGGVQRDAKGYSKVDKSKKQKNAEEGERGGGGDMAEDCNDPPPLPPRNYLDDDDESLQPGKSGGAESQSVASEGGGVAVSDV